jgi:hypothetical protein
MLASLWICAGCGDEGGAFRPSEGSSGDNGASTEPTTTGASGSGGANATQGAGAGGATATTGAGGAPNTCRGCADLMADLAAGLTPGGSMDSGGLPPCTGSQEKLAALVECACLVACQESCALACGGEPIDEACQACSQKLCADAYQACAADTGQATPDPGTPETAAELCQTMCGTPPEGCAVDPSCVKQCELLASDCTKDEIKALAACTTNSKACGIQALVGCKQEAGCVLK